MRKDYQHICSGNRHQVLGPDGSVLCSTYDEATAKTIVLMFNSMTDLLLLVSNVVDNSRLWPDPQMAKLTDTYLVPLTDLIDLDLFRNEYNNQLKHICGATPS